MVTDVERISTGGRNNTLPCDDAMVASKTVVIVCDGEKPCEIALLEVTVSVSILISRFGIHTC